MPDDTRVCEESFDAARREAGDFLGVEPLEGTSEVLALLQDREPAEARLKTLEADLLEQARVVGDREAPLRIVIADLQRIGPAPSAALSAVVTREEPQTWRVHPDRSRVVLTTGQVDSVNMSE